MKKYAYTIFHYKDGNQVNAKRYTPLDFDTYQEAITELQRYREIDKNNEVNGNFHDKVDKKTGTYSHDTDNYYVMKIEIID